jgi:hypothetical protein
MMKIRQRGTLAILLILGLSSASDAEYLIHLKGGHYITADNCTFSAHQAADKLPETGAGSTFIEDCARERPREGRIFWSTTTEEFGQVNADDVYAIVGTKNLLPIKIGVPMPLDDYLITNRDGSFVNAKTVEQKGVEIYGLKRDEPIEINRRTIIEIAPESAARSRSGEDLCPGEPAEFSVGETEMVSGNFVGVVTNLSKTPWNPWIDVEVSEKGRRLGKFQVVDSNVLAPDDSTAIDAPVPKRFLKVLTSLQDADAGVRLCYRKVKTPARESGGLEKASAAPPAE